ncbi:MAG: hypothetical protein JRD69_10335 [Deltaproteobacteria bacterium]|nr:hypothetical protein [Deltaproteobacteria bacterium]
MGYKSEVQSKNVAWFLPRPKKNKYRGGMPLYAEEWLIELAKDLLEMKEIRLLSLFSGASNYGFKVDIIPETKPDIIADVHNLLPYLPEDKREFDVVMADPPYSNGESKKLYGTPKLGNG